MKNKRKQNEKIKSSKKKCGKKKDKAKAAFFISLPIRRKLKGAKLFVTITKGVISIKIDKKWQKVTLSEGFLCDSTSLFYAVDSAGDFHDFLYFTKVFSRKNADLIYYYLMRDLDFSFLRAKIRFYGVRIFGFWGWKQNSKIKKETITNIKELAELWNNT